MISKRWRISLRILGLALLAGVVYGGLCLNDAAHRRKCEYTTARVIRDVTEWVDSHHGQWPQSWNDIPGSEHVREYVRMRFDVTVEELLEDDDLIYNVVVPQSGEYRTYPHARYHLTELRKLLREHRIRNDD